MVSGVLVVTGGSRGIGAAVCRLGAAAGYAVCVNYATDQRAASAVVDDIAAAGGKAIAVRADCGREDEILRLFETVDEALGPVTALVNNAAMLGGERKVSDAEAAHLARLWALNITGSYLCARESVRRMAISQGGAGGAIVNLSSQAARSGGRYLTAHYATSKGAISSFTLALAKEVAKDGIRVNAVLPGLIDTDFQAPTVTGAGLHAAAASAAALGRAGRPEEVAEAILWLLSDKGSYVTGLLMDVNGGR
jgi:NAD(P)-dependent dehydrogenase (short-subunit alcohol dehydrogenase family)